MIRIFVAAAGAAAAAMPIASASAQSYIVNDVIASTIANMSRPADGPSAACLSGQPLAPRRLDRVRARATTTMDTYLARAGASAAADVTSAYTRDAAKREWLLGGVPGNVATVDDPLARAIVAGRARLERPGTILAAGDGRSALAVWQVLAPDGSRLGHYRADFHRESGRFMIRQLSLVAGPAEPAALRPYCRRPGDVDEYVAEQTARKSEAVAEAAAEAARPFAALPPGATEPAGGGQPPPR